jgi:hypothetical protein
MGKKAKKAKKQLKKHKKKATGLGATTGALAGVATQVATKVLTQVIEDTITPHLKKGSKKKAARRDEAPDRPDPAAAVIRALCERGPQTIPDLLDRTRGRLVDLLRALRDLRQFHLVEWDDDDDEGAGRVRLTRSGDRTATVLTKGHIREDAAELVET